MARHSPVRGRATGLAGRRSERDVLDRLIDAVRAGEGRALVVTGESGVGKTALLDYLAGHAAGFRVARVMGVQSEMELAFAGVHQLCAPMLDPRSAAGSAARRAADLIRPRCGAGPERFLVGLAVLSLLTEVAGGAAAGLRGR